MSVGSNSYKLSEEENLSSTYENLIEPFWQEQVQHGQFVGVDEIKIAYAYIVHPQSIGSIVISTGRIEASLKYKELIYDLYNNAYSVFIHDHRGQGYSGRMLDNPHMGYVDTFDDYVTDFKTFVDQRVLPNSSHKPYLLGHSMGCAIGALYCLNHPNDFAKAAFCAPMFGIRPALPAWLASALIASHTLILALSAKKVGYFFGQQDYANKPFANNALSQSEIRYKIFRQEYIDNFDVQIGGVTGHWLAAAGEAMERIERESKNFPIPALVIQASADSVVDNKRQSRVSGHMARTQCMQIAGARHEILMEQDQYRQPCINAILNFYAEQ